MSDNQPDQRVPDEARITRTFDAPVDRVYRAWIDPEQFAHWFGAELEVPQSYLEMDVRPGGQWKATMLHEGGELPFGGEYLELVENERLVMTFDDPERIGAGNVDVNVLTVTFTPIGEDRTEVLLSQTGLMEHGMADDLVVGYNSFMDKLAELLARD
ncbi:SRPBCC domain-containing protein [Diaminobutyricimonas sp. TR449]|uniref:SRPBCC family protein n=1 Tax=Diaminobutyricimonas sp. TR449 TaxID=2708076 RepID=UPI00142357FD|nr:SRPBCC domain-containing protein [Diaminobutyricimonas sp. TR449]